MNALLLIFFITYGVYSFFYNLHFWVIYLILVFTYIYITQLCVPNSSTLTEKTSIATWSTPYDPQTYTQIKLNITKIESYIEEISKKINTKITLTTYAIKLMSLVLKKHPEVYGFIKFGRYLPKDNVDICCLVQVDDGKELANTTIKSCDLKDFNEITNELKSSVKEIRDKKNKSQRNQQNILSLIPTL